MLKPCRSSDSTPEFNAERSLANLSRGVETCLVLDLNILNHIKNYQQISAVERSPQLLGDVAAIKKILCTPGLFLAPGFAIGEADEKYLDELSHSYEEFLSAELSGYADAPNAIPIGRDRRRSRQFKSLSDDDRLVFALAHLALLKVHDMLLFEKALSPEAKFDMYLEYMDGVANIVPGIETEVAKHCFFKPAASDRDNFLGRSEAIRDNFNKGGRGEKRVDRILNGARDVMLIRTAAAKDGKALDGKIQDTWLLTTDVGLAALCSSIYFFPADGERAKFTRTVEAPYRVKNSYWRYVDKASHYVLSRRTNDRLRMHVDDTTKLLHNLRNLAQALDERLARQTVAF